MSDRQSQPNLRRLDGKAEQPTFAARLKLYWAPLASIGVIIAGTATAVLTATKPFTAKADAKVVARDELKQSSDHDLLIGLKTEVDDIKAGQQWTQGVVLQLAEEKGLHPAPVPTPHPLPVVTP